MMCASSPYRSFNKYGYLVLLQYVLFFSISLCLGLSSLIRGTATPPNVSSFSLAQLSRWRGTAFHDISADLAHSLPLSLCYLSRCEDEMSSKIRRDYFG